MAAPVQKRRAARVSIPSSRVVGTSDANIRLWFLEPAPFYELVHFCTFACFAFFDPALFRAVFDSDIFALLDHAL